MYLSVFIVLYYNNIYFQYKRTSLHIAAREGHFSVVQYLITSGADVEAVNDVSLNLVFKPGARRPQAWFLRIDPVRIVCMCVYVFACVCVCVCLQGY